MSYQIYFLQNEEDAVQFLDHLSKLNAYIWTGNTIISPNELKCDIVKQMSSFMCQYVIVPYLYKNAIQVNRKMQSEDVGGIEFLICCKKSQLSRTYEVGRIYYANCNNHSKDEQMLILYNKIKSYIRKNYNYNKNLGIYIAPQFKQKYDEKILYATQLGRSITL